MLDNTGICIFFFPFKNVELFIYEYVKNQNPIHNFCLNGINKLKKSL